MPPRSRTLKACVASAVQSGGGTRATAFRPFPRLKALLLGSLAARAVHLKFLRDGRKKAINDAKRSASTLFSRVLVSRRQAYGELVVKEDHEVDPGALKRKRGADVGEVAPPLAKRCLVDVRYLRGEHTGFVSRETNVPQMSQPVAPVGGTKFFPDSLGLCPCPGPSIFRRYLQQRKHKPIETALQRAQRLQASRLARSRKNPKFNVVKACREREALVHVPHARRSAHGESYDDYEPGNFASKRKRANFGIRKMDYNDYRAPPLMRRRTVHPHKALGFIVQLPPAVVAPPDPPLAAHFDLQPTNNGIAHDFDVPCSVPASATSLHACAVPDAYEVSYPNIPTPTSILAAFDSVSFSENCSFISYNDNIETSFSTNSRSCDFIGNVPRVPDAPTLPQTMDCDSDSSIPGIRCASINAYAGPVTHSLFQTNINCELDLSTISSTLSFNDTQTMTPPPTPHFFDPQVPVSSTSSIDADMTLVDDAAAEVLDKLSSLCLEPKMVCDTEEHSFIYYPAPDCIPVDVSMEDVDAFLDSILSDFQLHDTLVQLKPKFTPPRDVSPETERRIAEAFGEFDDVCIFDNVRDNKFIQMEEDDDKKEENNDKKEENDDEKEDNDDKKEENEENEVITLVTLEDKRIEDEEEEGSREWNGGGLWEHVMFVYDTGDEVEGGGGGKNRTEDLAGEKRLWKEIFGDDEDGDDENGRPAEAISKDPEAPLSPAGSLFSQTAEDNEDVDCIDLTTLALLPLIGQQGIGPNLRDTVDDSSLPPALFGLFGDLASSTSPQPNTHNKVSSLTRGRKDGRLDISQNATSDAADSQISQLSALFADLM